MRIYVASLTDYNAGILHGVWLDLFPGSHDADDLHCEIRDMLDESPTAARTGEPAEDYAIHDHEHCPFPLSEHTGVEEIAAWLDVLDEGAHDDEDMSEIVGALSILGYGGPSQVVDAIRRGAVLGFYASPEDYVEQLIDDGVWDVPEALRCYIDTAAMARDMGPNGEAAFVETSSGRTLVLDPSV